MDNNLPELRDIHLPNGVPFFPPAYGWWIILAVVICSILLFKLFTILKRRSKKIYALKLLERINSNSIVPAAVEISEILRRICIYKYPQAAAIYDKEWIEFLNAHTKQTLGDKSASLLINAPYIAANSKEYTIHNINDLTEFAKIWIGENL